MEFGICRRAFNYESPFFHVNILFPSLLERACPDIYREGGGEVIKISPYDFLCTFLNHRACLQTPTFRRHLRLQVQDQ